MVFKRGEINNPLGRSVVISFRDALDRAIDRASKGVDKLALVKIADQLIKQGLAGDLAAIREIADRLDGRPTQSIRADVQVTHGLADRIERARAVLAGGDNPHALPPPNVALTAPIVDVVPKLLDVTELDDIL